MKILITGANGSLGTELLIRMRDSGNEITALALDQNDTANLSNFKSVKIIYGNICTLSNDFLKEYLSGIDVFIHLAALVHKPKASQKMYYEINYDATKRLIDAFNKYSVSKIKQFIFISTVAVYGNYQSIEYSEDSECLPDTPYGNSKLLAEKYLKGAFINYTILRPATIYGGSNDKGNIAKLIKLLRKWHFFPLLNYGKTLKSFVSVTDVANSIINSINNEIAFGQVYNISAQALSLKEIINRIASKLKIKILTIPIPLPLFFLSIFSGLYRKLCQNNIYSFEKAEKHLKYRPKIFPNGL